MRGLTVGAVLALVTLVPACSGASTAAPPPPTSPTVTTTVPPSSPSSSSPPPSSPQAAPAAEVNCSAAGGGKVGPAGQAQVDVIAERTEAGLAGCAEAIAVITEFYRAQPEEDEVVTIQGWTCAADSGDEGTGIVVCEKAGLSFHTGQQG
ncbi:hypothetical protein GC106_52350 [Kibdelosporangium sp. 4NS15]|uniref:Uncharacterized protein n=1 Tax=Kibdelosporangium persicum TaxID=2698649 RepID=A0ABX2FA36_9PSEU|nr:hypothetical protein [Kibdelosporangium persicum]NRN67994.1 hypothetical protein [Kibdelosporangium persicum]